MSNNTDRGWTWGVTGATPVAAINTQGKMQIKSNFIAEGTVSAAGGNSGNWNTAYAERGSQVAGTGLTWSGGKLNASIGTDNQSISGSTNLANTILTIGIEGGGSQAVDFSGWDTNAADDFDPSDDVNFTGIVGIGTTTTGTHKLAVDGTIGAREITVELGTWSDFVFEPDYDLRPLAEVEEYINKNHHLPEIPSAAEVEENGINLGEMNAKLLQKIEELTLYLIEQNKTNGEQNNQLVTQNESMEKMQKQIDQLTETTKK